MFLITVSSLPLPPIFLFQGDGAGHRVGVLSLGSMVGVPNIREVGVAQGLVWGLSLQASPGVWAVLPTRQKVHGTRMGKGQASGMPSHMAGRGKCLGMTQQMPPVTATIKFR